MQRKMTEANAAVRETDIANVELEADGSEREVNQYRIGRKIGSGSFAEVRLCTNKFTGKQYAMKILSRSFLKRKKEFIRTGKGRPKIKTALEDVEREIAFMKKIRHRNIVALIEVIDDVAGDTIYMVMEYLPQGQVMTWNSKNKYYRDNHNELLSEERAREVFRDICRGLNYIHSHQMVHRDLKPENVLIGATGEAKIADFGVAQKVYFNESGEGVLERTAGTPWFYSPEAILDSQYDGFAADLWALGVCLLVFVTGRVPFFTEDIEKLYIMISNDKVDIPTKLSPDITRVLKGLLEKDVKKRWKLDVLKMDPWVNIGEEITELIEVTDSELQTAITVRISFFLAVKLKLFVRRWKARSLLNKTERASGGMIMDGKTVKQVVTDVNVNVVGGEEFQGKEINSRQKEIHEEGSKIEKVVNGNEIQPQNTPEHSCCRCCIL